MKKMFYEKMWQCLDSLRGEFAYGDCNRILIYMVFLKFIVDNKKLPLNNDTFSMCLEAQRMFDKAELNQESIMKLNYMIENHFEMSSGSLTEFSNLYFKVIEMRKSQKSTILERLCDISFENENTALLEAIKMILWETTSSFGRMMGEEVSTKSLSNVMKELLLVQDGESFADFAYGFGLSSLEITDGKQSDVTGYEMNKNTATLAQMLLIISGKEKFAFYHCDATKADMYSDSFDKIGIVPPLGVKMRELDDTQKSLLEEFTLPVKSANMEVLLSLQGIKSLKENGKMVIAVTPSILFSATLVEKKFREFISNHYLSAVITLPSLYYGTAVATNLLVLEKKRKTKEVIFIDSSGNDFFLFANKDKKAQTEMTEEGIGKIVEIIETEQAIEGISYSCSVEELQKNDFLLSPSRYVQVVKKRERLSNEEIDERLRELYAEINRVIH